AQRVRAEPVVRPGRQADTLEDGIGGALRQAAGFREQLEVATSGEAGEEGRCLDDRSDAPDHLREIGADVRAEHVALAAVRTNQAQQAPDRRRLARSVWTEEAVDDARRHVEIDPRDGDRVAAEAATVCLAEIADFYRAHLRH